MNGADPRFKLLIIILATISLFFFFGLIASSFAGQSPWPYVVGLIFCGFFGVLGYLKSDIKINIICKANIDVKTRVGQSLICARCLGFYFGLFISVSISALRPFSLTVEQLIVGYLLVILLNALQGNMRRKKTSPTYLRFFSSDKVAFVLGFLFGLATSLYPLTS